MKRLCLSLIVVLVISSCLACTNFGKQNEMYFEDFNYNAGTDHLFYTTVEYDFTSEDGERYYIDYHEGKLEEYLNVREMQPGGKYMLLYDVKSGQVLDVKTLE